MKSKAVTPSKQKIFINSEWFLKILLSLGEAVIATDAKGKVSSMNKVAEELTGWKEKDSTGKSINTIFDAINESTKRPIKNPVMKALKGNTNILLTNHTILIRKDKTQRIIEDSAVPIHDDDKKVIGSALIFRDVTERAHNKNRLAESEGLLKGIMENTALIIYIKDIEGKYLFINHQKELVYNIKASNLIGKKSLIHLTPKHAAESERTDLRALKGESLVEYEQVIKHADGTVHNYQTSKFPLYDADKKVYAVCSISTDITESKKNIELQEQLTAHEEVQKSELRYDELTKNMPNLFFSLDRAMIFTSFNKACEKFTGKEASQVIGKSMEKAFRGNSPLFQEESKAVLKSGKAQNFVSTFTLDTEPSTYAVNIYPTEKGISVLMTDLTRQKKAEAETLDLIGRLQEKNKDLRQFAYAVSHDLRAPIVRIQALANLAETDPGFKIKDKSIIETVATEINNLDEFVKDMHAVISAREGSRKKAYVDFAAELELVKIVLEKEIEESQAVITMDFAVQKGMVTVKTYLYSIMYNLLTNAIKYRRPAVPLSIHLSSAWDNGYVCLTVMDNGLGIDLEKNGEKIFGLYNRFHKTKAEGRGVGLNLVRTQAESLGGKVKVESQLGHGSSFKIYFPKNLMDATG